MTKFQPAYSGPPAKHLSVFHSCFGCQGQPGPMKERTAAREPFLPSILFLSDPHHHGRASFPSLCFAFSSSFFSDSPMSLPPLPSYIHSLFCLHPPSTPSLPGPYLIHFPAPSLGGRYFGPAECWTPNEVAECWAPTPFPLLSGVFSGDLEEGREAGKGRAALETGLQMCFWWH